MSETAIRSSSLVLGAIMVTASLAWAADQTTGPSEASKDATDDPAASSEDGVGWQHGLTPYSDVPAPESEAEDAKALAPSGNREWQVGLSDWKATPPKEDSGGVSAKPSSAPSAASTPAPAESLKARNLISGKPPSTAPQPPSPRKALRSEERPR
ncbi:MAG: hypothetical protein HY737_08765 [Candidatus Omnitrophica bacterium]|nr:hypothetical protein [Candidatus Omnitrophota bacterium]